jgi:putative DNA primase/helicase
MSEPSKCPRDGKILVEVSGSEGRFLECICGYKFDANLSREVSTEPAESIVRERASGQNVRELAYELAEQITESDTFVTINGSEEILHYEGGIYREGGEFTIKSKVQELASPKDLGNNLVAEVLGNVRRSTYIQAERFTESSSLVVLENGILDVDSCKVIPHTPDHCALSKLPVKFDLAADCPMIKKFLSEVLYPEDLSFIQEWVGYHLWRGYPTAIAALFVGEGANGKSTLIGVLRAFLGPKNVAAIPLQAFERNTFAKAGLMGKMANLYPDLSDEALKQVGTFKALTGGDMLTAEKKFGQPFNFANYAKLTFSCNVVPEVWEDTEAFFRRIWIVSFPNTFQGEKADRDLLAKLVTPEELSGFLNWALDGLKRLRASGWRFTGTRSTAEVKADYIRRSDTVRAFLNNCTKKTGSAFVTRDDLYDSYCAYCRERNLVTKNRVAFFDKLPQFGQFLKEQRTVAGKRKWAVVGLELLAKDQWERSANEDAELVLNGDLPVQPVQPVQDRLANAQPAQTAQPFDDLREDQVGRQPAPGKQPSEEAEGPKGRLIQPKCSVCGIPLSTPEQPTIFAMKGKHYCKEHFPKKGTKEEPSD